MYAGADWLKLTCQSDGGERSVICHLACLLLSRLRGLFFLFLFLLRSGFRSFAFDFGFGLWLFSSICLPGFVVNVVHINFLLSCFRRLRQAPTVLVGFQLVF